MSSSGSMSQNPANDASRGMNFKKFVNIDR